MNIFRTSRPTRSSWEFGPCLRALSSVLGQPLLFDTASELRAKLYAAHPDLALLDAIVPADSAAIERLASSQGKFGKERFGHSIEDFYLSNPIARSSPIMASLSALHAGAGDKATGTDG